MSASRGTTAQNPSTMSASCSRVFYGRVGELIHLPLRSVWIGQCGRLIPRVFFWTILYESREAEAYDQWQSHPSAVLMYSSPHLELCAADKWINSGATNWPTTTHGAR